MLLYFLVIKRKVLGESRHSRKSILLDSVLPKPTNTDFKTCRFYNSVCWLWIIGAQNSSESWITSESNSSILGAQSEKESESDFSIIVVLYLSFWNSLSTVIVQESFGSTDAIELLHFADESDSRNSRPLECSILHKDSKITNNSRITAHYHGWFGVVDNSDYDYLPSPSFGPL